MGVDVTVRMSTFTLIMTLSIGQNLKLLLVEGIRGRLVEWFASIRKFRRASGALLHTVFLVMADDLADITRGLAVLGNIVIILLDLALDLRKARHCLF